MGAGKVRAHGNHVVIKTHQWSEAWQVQQADHIFLTHRDLQGVVASYRRVGWAFNIPASYVEEHQQWRLSPAPADYVMTVLLIRQGTGAMSSVQWSATPKEEMHKFARI